MKIKRVISCLLVAVFSMSLLLVQESAQAKNWNGTKDITLGASC